LSKNDGARFRMVGTRRRSVWITGLMARLPVAERHPLVMYETAGCLSRKLKE
jgi:hypothetical protein